jgi:hypothetical protein
MMPDAFAYDAFISYRHQEPDRAWARSFLLPTLEAAGLRVCIDHRDFRLGAPLVTEMARAVEQSRTTVAVLTPAYLAGRFAELENVLAEHLGLEERSLRLLYVVREPCEPPLRMRARLRLDLTTEAEVEVGIPRLVAALTEPAPSASGERPPDQRRGQT